MTVMPVMAAQAWIRCALWSCRLRFGFSRYMSFLSSRSQNFNFRRKSERGFIILIPQPRLRHHAPNSRKQDIAGKLELLILSIRIRPNYAWFFASGKCTDMLNSSSRTVFLDTDSSETRDSRTQMSNDSNHRFITDLFGLKPRTLLD